MDMSQLFIALIQGKAEPKNKYEKLFLHMYKAGLSGLPLLQVLNDLGENIQKMTVDDYDYLVIGYAFGQQDYMEALNQIEAIKTGQSTAH